MNKKVVLALTTLLLFSSLNAEPSAFGAGDINNPEPYGLTQEEQLLLENKKHLNNVSSTLKKVTVNTNNQSNELDSIRDRIDGLQSVIENLSRKEFLNQKNLRSIDETYTQRFQSIDEYQKRLSEVSQKNIEEIEKLKLLTSEISILVEKISKDYVTKAEFNSLVKDINNFKDLVSKELSQTSKGPFSNKTHAQIAKEAKSYYDKKDYTNAVKYYTHLIEVNYKPARSHYMVGEINYYTKNYSDAIAYFKKSAELYSKASYMPTLMLHTAISMKNNGDDRNAKSFLNATIKKYPDSKAAIEAKKQLDSIK